MNIIVIFVVAFVVSSSASSSVVVGDDGGEGGGGDGFFPCRPLVCLFVVFDVGRLLVLPLTTGLVFGQRVRCVGRLAQRSFVWTRRFRSFRSEGNISSSFSIDSNVISFSAGLSTARGKYNTYCNRASDFCDRQCFDVMVLMRA